MITIYFVEADGRVVEKVIKKSQLLSYKNLGWTEEKPVDFAGAVEQTGPESEVDFGDGEDTIPSPFGLSLIHI